MIQSNYLNEYIWWNFFHNFSTPKSFSNRSNKWLRIMFCLMSAVALVKVKIWHVHVKALGMRMRKLVLGLSAAQRLPEKINKTLSPNKLGFIDVNRTVFTTIAVIFCLFLCHKCRFLELGPLFSTWFWLCIALRTL